MNERGPIKSLRNAFPEEVMPPGEVTEEFFRACLTVENAQKMLNMSGGKDAIIQLAPKLVLVAQEPLEDPQIFLCESHQKYSADVLRGCNRRDLFADLKANCPHDIFGDGLLITNTDELSNLSQGGGDYVKVTMLTYSLVRNPSQLLQFCQKSRISISELISGSVKAIENFFEPSRRATEILRES